MGTCHSHLTAPARIYRLLLLLYPPGFRVRFGPEMIQVFEDSRPPTGRSTGSATRMDFWRLTLRDLAQSLATEWWQAMLRPRRLELPLRQWADSLVIPFTVFGYLMVEGNLGAALVRTPLMLPGVRVCSESWLVACMVANGILIALTLALLGILSAMITARNSRAEIWSIKL